jgi:hypothetical protein
MLQVFYLTERGVQPARRSTKSTGYGDDMLSLTRDSVAQMPKYAIEEIVLKQVDQEATLVRDKLLDHGLTRLDHDERCAWVRFIMSLRIRQPDIVADLRQQSATELRRNMAEEPEEYETVASDDDPSSLEDWAERRFPGLVENFGLSFFHELLNDDAVGNKLLHLQWWVFDVTPAPCRLLLSDHPCIFVGSIDDPNLAVILPISSTKVFIATRGEELKRLLPKQQPKHMTTRINDASVRQSNKFVYAVDASPLRFIKNRWRIAA